MQNSIYVEVSHEELETKEFEDRLKKAYAEKGNSQEVFLVIDGKVLKDPNNGGPVQKIGKNLYYGELSGIQFKMDDGNIEHLKSLLRTRPSGLHELRDPNNGTPLMELEDSVYETCFRDIFVATTQDKLEDPEFNKKLERLYEQYNKGTINQNVRLIVDGNELRDPICGGDIKKIGENLYKGTHSGNTFLMIDGNLMDLREPIAGTPIKLQEDGRYYSDVLDKYFTLEQAKDGSNKFFPAYLPYDGMTDVEAKVVGDRLVGENGISFPLFENGGIDYPMDDGLKTQEEIDENIAKKHEMQEKVLKEMQEKLDRELEEKRKIHEDEMAKIDLRIEAINLAGDLEAARAERNIILQACTSMGISLDLVDLPEMPEIPEYMPPELLQEEIDRLRQVEKENKKNDGPLKMENVLQVSQTASAKDMGKMVERIDRGMDLALSPEKVQEGKNQEDLLEKENDDERN